MRRKPARKNPPLTAPREPAQPWKGEPWRIGPQGMDLAGVKERWTGAQGGFVDDPARAVREADALAAEVADAVVAGIEARRAQLCAVWDGETAKADTESLRLVLREYRSYVERLAGDRPGTGTRPRGPGGRSALPGHGGISGPDGPFGPGGP